MTFLQIKFCEYPTFTCKKKGCLTKNKKQINKTKIQTLPVLCFKPGVPCQFDIRVL